MTTPNNSLKQRVEQIEKLTAYLQGKQRGEGTVETNDGVVEVRLARTCDDGDYPVGASKKYPLMFLDGPNGVYRDRSGSCRVEAYSITEECVIEKDTKVFAWKQNNTWFFVPGVCGQGDQVDHILVCKPDAAITDCCLYDARMIVHRKGPEGYCNEITEVTPVWARCSNGFVEALPDGYCLLGKKLDDPAICTLDDIAEEREVYLIDCGTCPNCICPDPCDSLTARIQVLPDICGLGVITCQMQCVDGNPLQVDDGDPETHRWYYGEFEVDGIEQRMLWGAGGRVWRETSPGNFEWVDESFWVELDCQGETGHVVGCYLQEGEPGSVPCVEDYELETGIDGCCPFLDSAGNPQYTERTYHYALTCFCDPTTDILDSLRIWWLKDSWGQVTGDRTTQTTACDDECPSGGRPTLADVPSPTGWWAANSFEAVGECCANSKRFRTELVIDECHQDFTTDPEIRIAEIPNNVPDTDPPEPNSNTCPGCVMGGSHIFAGCECGVLSCDGGDALPKICDFDPSPIPEDGEDCLTHYIVVDVSWPLTWSAGA